MSASTQPNLPISPVTNRGTVFPIIDVANTLRRMTSRRRQLLSTILSLLVALSTLLNLVSESTLVAKAETSSTQLLTETIEEGEAEESADFEFFLPVESQTLAVEVSLTAHVFEEEQHDGERYRRVHRSQGPPDA